MTVLGRALFHPVASGGIKDKQEGFRDSKTATVCFSDFQYIARFVILGSTLYRPLIEGRNMNHIGRVYWAFSLLYEATVPISRHKVVFFHSVANASFKVVTV